jgi:serine/threonine-protein kinase
VTPELRLDEIADAILDGTPVDWSSLDLSEAATDQALVAQLKTLETLRRGRMRDPAPSESWNWGHLRVLECIGRGAYGDVYRAWDTRLDREVALKLLPSDDPGAAPSDSTVIDEGRLLARVRHPNVATIYGAERIDGRVGLWMEYVQGRTLEEALRGGQKFTVAEVTRLGAELCHAVSAVHAAGLLHRDIKAQNVMLDHSGRLVLMDFGTGRELEATDMHIAGTPLYLAPEVLSGAAATPRSDAYSIGVVLFRLLTNTYPVLGADLADLRRAHAAGGDAADRVNRPEIPLPVRRVLARAIDPDPARRYDTADELAAALAATERTPGRRRVVLAVAIAAVIVAAGAIGWNLGPAPTIAVLPFTNVGSDPGQDDFIDGLTTSR